MQAGLRPVLVDVDAGNLLPTPATVAAAARRAGRPAAMIIQHMAGHPADVAELAAAAGLPRRRIVEDAAHGLGAELRGTPVGGGSHAACFSFYATKNLPIGEGGAIATDDDELAALRAYDPAARPEPRRLATVPARWQLAVRRGRARPQGEHHRRPGGDRPGPARLPAAVAAAPGAAGRAVRRGAGRRARTRPAVRPAEAGTPGTCTRCGSHPACGSSRDAVIDALASAAKSARRCTSSRCTSFPPTGGSCGPEECRSVPVTDQVAEEVVVPADVPRRSPMPNSPT